MIGGVLKKLVRGSPAETPKRETPPAPRPFRMTWLADEQRGVLYCPIPKNACSTIKYWLATVADGACPDLPRGAIHPYTRDRLSLARFTPEEARAIVDRSVSFVVLRDPAERLVSAFADKLVSPRAGVLHTPGKTVIEACVRTEQGGLELDTEIAAFNGVEQVMRPASSSIDYTQGVSLRRMVAMIERTPDRQVEPHFRPQVWFTAGFDFDIVGTIRTLHETLSEVSARTAITTPLPEPRQARSGAETDGGSECVCYADEPSGSLRDRGVRPTVTNMLDEELKARIRERFAGDYAMLAQTGADLQNKPSAAPRRD